ncbi:4a-hydroxytetrahydrobiopterin dehydratase [Gordonia iterans]
MGDQHYTTLTEAQAAAQAPEGWFVGDGELSAGYRTGSMIKGLDFVNRVVIAAEAVDHHPDVELSYGVVGFTLSTHATGGLTTADVGLAQTIAEIAAARGLTPEPRNTT